MEQNKNTKNLFLLTIIIILALTAIIFILAKFNINFGLTLVLSLIIGVMANIITPTITKLGAELSRSAREKYAAKQTTFNKTVQYLIDNPQEEINLRVEKNKFYICGVMLMSWTAIIAILLGRQLSNNIVMRIMIITVGLCGMVYFIRAKKCEWLIDTAWEKRTEQHRDIDLNF